MVVVLMSTLTTTTTTTTTTTITAAAAASAATSIVDSSSKSMSIRNEEEANNNNATCEMTPDVEYGDNCNIGATNASTPAECCAHCYAKPGCAAYAWHPATTTTTTTTSATNGGDIISANTSNISSVVIQTTGSHVASEEGLIGGSRENCWLHSRATPVTKAKKPGRISGRCARGPPPPPPRACSGGNYSHYPFCDTKLSVNERVADLVSRINDNDKPALLTARAVQDLPYVGVPAYYWGTNCIQSVEAGAHHESPQRCVGDRCPTHFPNPPGWASSFNRTAMEAMAAVMAKEIRALYNIGVAKGVDCWGPVVSNCCVAASTMPSKAQRPK